MWYVYIIFSEKIDHYYIGVTDNLTGRWRGIIKDGANIPNGAFHGKLVYTESFEHKTNALKREREFRDQRAGNILKD